MKEKNIKSWESAKKLGERKYILYYFILGWGVISATIYNGIYYFLAC